MPKEKEPSRYLEETEEEKFEIEHSVDPGSAWLIPYGNMMTVLMVFFLILYVFSYQVDTTTYERVIVNIQKQFALKGKVAENVARKVEEAESAKELSDFYEKEGLDRFVKVEIDAERVRVMLSNPVLFSLGKAELKEEAKKYLKPVVKLIKIGKIASKVIIEGHTDNIPIVGGKYKSNWELSADRAISVINYFVKEEGLSPEIFAVAGYGEYKPVAPNDTE
ncbi:MAG: flagellar motor protein MotB, partial [Endomicrobiia bacterium]